MSGWQVKLCDPIVTHGPYLIAVEIKGIYMIGCIVVNDMYVGQTSAKLIVGGGGGGGYNMMSMDMNMGQQSLMMDPTDCLSVCVIVCLSVCLSVRLYVGISYRCRNVCMYAGYVLREYCGIPVFMYANSAFHPSGVGK